MNTLVIGLGSIGSRHVRVLEEMKHRVATVSQHLENSLTNYHELKKAILDHRPDYIVVANETDKHEHTFSLIKELGFGGKLLIEKPLNFKDNLCLDSGNPLTYVGFNLRFHPALTFLRNLLSSFEAKIIEVNFEYGNSTNNWRLGENSEKSYSRSDNTGGGVLRDFSHELDLARWLFEANEIKFASGRMTGTYMIDSNDYVQLILQSRKDFLVTVSLNFLQSYPSRTIRIFSTEGKIEIDLIKSLISVNGNVTSFENSENHTYTEMHRAILVGESLIPATLDEGLAVDALIRRAESQLITKRNR